MKIIRKDNKDSFITIFEIETKTGEFEHIAMPIFDADKFETLLNAQTAQNLDTLKNTQREKTIR